MLPTFKCNDGITLTTDTYNARAENESNFEELIRSYTEHQIGISDGFIRPQLASSLRDKLMSLHDQQSMHAAGIGNEENVKKDLKIRGDSIYWLDRKHHDPYENDFFDLMDAFVVYLNHSCYTGITGYEFHYALYEKGSFYKKHIDQFKTDTSRQFSMISYLNEGWVSKDGGELLIQLPEQEQTISPTSGKTVFFKSNELEHEVLPTQKNRMSITGWLKRD